VCSGPCWSTEHLHAIGGAVFRMGKAWEWVPMAAGAF
jgi:hypothetical protein